MYKKIGIFLIFLFFTSSALNLPIHAGEYTVDPGTNQGIGGGTNAGTPGRTGNFLGIPIRDLGGDKGLLTILLQTSLIFAGIGFFIYLIFGGIKWLVSGGDKTAMQSAKDTLTQAFTGLIIIIAVYGVIVILERLFGLSILSRGIKFPTP